MREPNHGRETIRRYLLGDLNEEDRQQVEERIFTDGEYRQEVLMIEDELLDEYSSNELTETERELFRLNYLSTPRQSQKLRVAHALNKYAADHIVPLAVRAPESGLMRRLINFARSRRHFTQLVFASAVVVLMLMGVWFGWQRWRLRSLSAALDKELARLNSPTSLTATPDSTVATVTLTRVQLRDPNSGLNTVKITPDIRIVRLQILHMPKKYETYRATISESGGSQMLTVIGLKPLGDQDTLVVQFPARIFSNNDYVLTIEGIAKSGQTEDMGEYAFRVDTAR